MFSSPSSLSHVLLRAKFTRLSKLYSDPPNPYSPPSHASLRNARILEVYHMGIALCDAHICSAAAIQDLVLTRISAILKEAVDQSSAPGGLGVEGEEMSEDATSQGQQQQQQQQQQERDEEENTEPETTLETEQQRPPTFTNDENDDDDDEDMQDEANQTTASSSHSSPTKPSHSLHLYPTSQPLIRHSHTIEYEKEPPLFKIWQDPPSPSSELTTTTSTTTIFRPIAPRPPHSNSINPACDQVTAALAADRRTPPLHSPLSPKDMSFQQVRREFQRALDGYNSVHGTELRSIDEYEIREALREGIERAGAPEEGITPEMLWYEIETSILKSARRERERQDRVEEEDEAMARAG